MSKLRFVPSRFSRLIACVSSLPVLLAALLLPVAALAQEGTSSYNFGSQAIGASTTQAMTLTIPSNLTLGGIVVSTQGAANLDFTNAGGGSCTVGTGYAASAKCTVSVTFTPTLAGTRYGAAVLTASNGEVIATDLLEGVGTGPQFHYLPATEIAVAARGLNQPANLMVDGSGNLYFVDSGTNRVMKATWSGSSYTLSKEFSSSGYIGGLAVDGSGNLYIAVAGEIWKKTWNGSSFAQSTVGSGLSDPNGISVDSSGNVYIADVNNGRVVKETLSAGVYTQSTILTCGGGGPSCPSSVAVDGSGDVFVTAYNSGQITRLTPSGGGYTQSTINANLNGPSSIAVDGLGNLYIADTQNSRAVELTLTSNGYVQSTVSSSGLDQPLAVAVDQLGNVYISDSGHQRVLKEDLGDAPTLSFALTYLYSTSSDSPKTVQIFNYGNQTLAITGVNYPEEFPEANGDPNACTGSTNLSAGQECDLPIDFIPLEGCCTAQLNEDVTITDNAQNVVGAQQSVAVSGTWWWDGECGCAVSFDLTAPSTVVAGVPFNMTVRADDGFGETVLDFSGDIDLLSSDLSAVLPPGLFGLPGGMGTFQATLQTPGTQTIIVSGRPADCPPGYPCSPPVSINVLAATHVAGQSSVNFGSQAIGSSSEAQTLNFSFSPPGNWVGSIAVLTQGAPNLDFTQAAGSTCTATTYSSATNCTVNVIFTPKAAGLRMGAVVFFAGAGNTGIQLASVPIYGVGTGPQVAYGPGTATAIGPGLNGTALSFPVGVAVDGLGNLFIADLFRVVKVPAGGGAATAISPTLDDVGLYLSWGLEVDGAGDVFIANTYWQPVYVFGEPYPGTQVVEAPSGGGLAKAIAPGLRLPTGVAVDGAGDVFIADGGNNRVVEVPASGGAAIPFDPTVNGLGLNLPEGVAVDGSGDLFIADAGNGRVVEIPAGGGEPIAIDPVVNGLGLSVPVYYPTYNFSGTLFIAVDAAGDLFIADTNNNRVVEAPAGGGAAIAIDPVVNGLGLSAPAGIAVDGTGNLFITDSYNNRVIKIQRSKAPVVNFPTATPVGSIDTIDGTQTVQILNIGNQALNFTAVSYPADFSEPGGDASACTSSTVLSVGQECDVPIDFTPTNLGSALNENVTLTDNALSGAGTHQSIGVAGASQATPPALNLPAPGSVLNGPEVTFSWPAAPGATGYSLWIGTTGAGSNNVYGSGERSVNSVTVAGLPTNGGTIYVRLYTSFGEGTVHSDYVYTATTRAAMISPAGGSALGGTSQTFSWSASTGASGYSLWLSGIGPGLNDLFDSKETNGTSATANGLPTNGGTIYARLYTTYGNATVYSDYTFLAF